MLYMHTFKSFNSKTFGTNNKLSYIKPLINGCMERQDMFEHVFFTYFLAEGTAFASRVRTKHE